MNTPDLPQPSATEKDEQQKKFFRQVAAKFTKHFYFLMVDNKALGITPTMNGNSDEVPDFENFPSC